MFVICCKIEIEWKRKERQRERDRAVLLGNNMLFFARFYSYYITVFPDSVFEVFKSPRLRIRRRMMPRPKNVVSPSNRLRPLKSPPVLTEGAYQSITGAYIPPTRNSLFPGVYTSDTIRCVSFHNGEPTPPPPN